MWSGFRRLGCAEVDDCLACERRDDVASPERKHVIVTDIKACACKNERGIERERGRESARESDRGRKLPLPLKLHSLAEGLRSGARDTHRHRVRVRLH